LKRKDKRKSTNGAHPDLPVDKVIKFGQGEIAVRSPFDWEGNFAGRREDGKRDFRILHFLIQTCLLFIWFLNLKGFLPSSPPGKKIFKNSTLNSMSLCVGEGHQHTRPDFNLRMNDQMIRGLAPGRVEHERCC